MKNLSKFKTTLAVSLLLSGSAFSMEKASACNALEEALSYADMAKKGAVTRSQTASYVEVARAGQKGGDAGASAIILQHSGDFFDGQKVALDVFAELKKENSNAVWFDAVNNPDSASALANLAASIYAEREAEHNINVFRAAFKRDRGHCGSHEGQFRNDAPLFGVLEYAAFRLENSAASQELDVLKRTRNAAMFKQMIDKENNNLLEGRKDAAARKMQELKLRTLAALNERAVFEDFDKAIGFTPCTVKEDKKIKVKVLNQYGDEHFEGIETNLLKFQDESLENAQKELQDYNLTSARKDGLVDQITVAKKRVIYSNTAFTTAEKEVNDKVKVISEERMRTKQVREVAQKQQLLTAKILELQLENANILDTGCYAPYRKNAEVRKQMAYKHMKDVDALLHIIASNGHQGLLERGLKNRQNDNKADVNDAKAELCVALFSSSPAYVKSFAKKDCKTVEAVLNTQIVSIRKQLAAMDTRVTASEDHERKEDAKVVAAVQKVSHCKQSTVQELACALLSAFKK